MIIPDFITRGRVFKTTDAGANWTYTDLPGASCSNISIPHPDTIYVTTGTVVEVSHDHGTTWNPTALPASIYWGLNFNNSKKGIVAGQYSNCFSTTDGGTTWTTHTFASSVYRDAIMLDDQIWYAVGRGGLIRKSSDGGSSWDVVNSGSKRYFYDISFGPDGTGYILGEDGIILRKANVETFTLTFNITENGAGNIDNAVVTLNGFAYPAGQYEFSGLLPGVYNWSISAPTFCTQTGITNVTDNTQEMIVMDHCFQAIVTVTNIYNQPVEGADVTLAANTQQTNAGGIAIFTLVQANNIPVDIEADNYLPFAGNVTITGDTTYSFELNADIEAPVALAATDIAGHSFKANWTKPGNADSCLLFVSELNDFTSHLEGYYGKAYSGTSAVIAGLDPDKQYFYRLKAKNVYGISEYSNSISCTTLPVSNKEITGLNQNLIYPNPATGRIFIKTAGISSLKKIVVFDLEGKCLVEDNRLLQEKDLISLDISFLKTGTYFVQLLTEDKTLQSVFIKK